MRLVLKRAWRVGGGVLLTVLLAASVAMFILRDTSGEPTPVALILLSACALIAVASITRRLTFVAPSSRAGRASSILGAAEALADLEVGVALVATTFAVLAVSGGIASPLHPLIYGVVAFAAAAQRRSAAIAVVGVACALEVALVRGSGAGALILASHLTFILGAAASHVLLFRGLVRRARRHFTTRVDAAISRQAESARDYRLIGAALSVESRPDRVRNDEENLLAAGSAEVVSANAYHALTLLRRSLGARTAVLLWLDSSGRFLKIKELDSECNPPDALPLVEAESIAVGGVLGAAIRDIAPVVMAQTRSRQVAYYETSEPVGAFIGVPVLDGPHVRGVLAIDRPRPFEDEDVALVESAAEQVMRAIRSEQVFAALERSKYEHERFYQATAMLGRALTFEQVIETAFDAAAQIVDHELAVISLYDRERRRHRVVGSRVEPGSSLLVKPETLTDLEFRDNQGLAAMVVKNRHFLPAAGEVRDATAPIFTRKVRMKGAESLLVLPLLSAEEPVGTFTLASARRGAFRSDIREMLGVIANQVAVSIENGLIYKKMETMATTDGLTELTNHRSFQESFDDLLQRAQRHDHQAAMLLCDVDHFKHVNDTYGHPVGDEVLRQVAAVLRNAVRKIDIPARYGGEEFAVVLEATDLKGAIGLAERIRKDVGALLLPSDKGTFQITMSIGISSFPADSTDKAELIERADLALYHAKETGRNRVVSFSEFDAARRKRAG